MDLSQLYGPGFAGYLHGVDSVRQNDMQGLRGMGMLSNMQTAQLERNAMQAQMAEKQRAAQQQTEMLQQVQGALQQPDAVVEAQFGMPAGQARSLFATGGLGALSGVLKKNAEQTPDQKLIGGLPQDMRLPAMQAKAGIGPKLFQQNTGGQANIGEYSPVTGPRILSSTPMTSAPASRPAWLNQDGSVNEELYQRETGLRRAGAAQGPSLTISSPLIPGKEAQNKVDQGILDTGQQMSSLTAIEQAFKPEYQTIGTKWGALKTGMKERLGLGVSAQDKQLLQDFTKYRATSANALNSYIKAMTGAALSEAEADRLQKAIPVAGTGIFDGDSPTEFRSKLDSVMRDLRTAMARHTYIKRRGFSIGDVPLDQMPRIMNARGEEIKQEIKASGVKISDAELKLMMRRRVAEEFGLVYEQ